MYRCLSHANTHNNQTLFSECVYIVGTSICVQVIISSSSASYYVESIVSYGAAVTGRFSAVNQQCCVLLSALTVNTGLSIIKQSAVSLGIHFIIRLGVVATDHEVIWMIFHCHLISSVAQWCLTQVEVMTLIEDKTQKKMRHFPSVSFSTC